MIKSIILTFDFLQILIFCLIAWHSIMAAEDSAVVLLEHDIQWD